jgi:CHAD domain-containing protein
MSFRIDPGAPLDAEIRRIADEQIGKAVAELSAPQEGDDTHEAIHDVRKRMKKLRALFRLVRAGDEDFFRSENARYRDTARTLSAARDRTALIEALDSLREHVPASLSAEAVEAAFAPLRQELEAKRTEAVAAEGDLDATIAATLDALHGSRAALDGLSFRPRRAVDIASAGYARTHDEARSALKRAERTGEAEDLHALRKHVKYLGFHLARLAPLWPEVFAPQRDAAGDIADGLGRDHDFAVLRAELDAERHALVLALMDRRQAELQAEGLAGARRLLAEKPAAAKARIGRLLRDAARSAKASAKASATGTAG